MKNPNHVVVEGREHGLAQAMATLRTIAEAMSAQQDLRTLLETSVEAVVKGLAVERATIYLLDGDRISDFVTTGVPAEKMPLLESLRGRPVQDFPISQRLAETNEPIILPDAQQGDLIPHELARALGMRSTICAPLRARGRAVGALFLDTSHRRAFTTDEIILVKAIADQVAVAIENVSLYRKLAASEATYRSIFESAVVGIYRSSPEGKFLAANTTLARMLGCASADELLALPAASFYPDPSDRDRWREDIERVGFLDGERMLRRVDGRVIWVHDVARAVRDSSGRLLYYEGTLIDITEKKQTEEHLRHSSQWLRQLFENAPLGIIMVDEQDRVLEANRGFETIFQYRAEEVRGRRINEIIVPPAMEPEASVLSQRVLAGERIDVETVRQRKDGQLVPVRIYGVPVTVEGKQVGLYGMYVDMSEHRRAEDELRASEERYRLLFEHNLAGVFRTSLDGRFLDCNPSLARLLGYEAAEELRGRHTWEFYWDPAEREVIREIVRTQGSITGYELCLRRRDGRPVWVLENVNTVFDEGGSPAYYLGTLVDISQRKRAEKITTSLYRISEAAHEARTLDELFASIHRIVADLMPAENFYIALYDAGTEMLSFPYFVDEKDEPPAPRQRGRGLTEYVLRTGEPLLACREGIMKLIERGEVELIGTIPVDWLGVPLKVNDKAIGVLTVQSYSEGIRYGEEEKNILRFVSNQIGMAIERKRAAEALRRSQQQYQMLVEAVSDIVISLDPEGRISYVNPSVRAIAGYTPEEVIGRHFTDFVYPEDIPKVEEILNRRRRGDTQPGEFRALAKSGDVRYLQSLGQYLWEGDRILGFTGTLRDITERVRTEQRLGRIYEIVTRYQGNELFNRAAAAVAELLGTTYAVIGEMDESTRGFRSLAFYHEGKVEAGTLHDPTGTPCESVIAERRLRIIPRHASHQFPRLVDLVGSPVECYIGAPITEDHETVLGVVCAFDPQPKEFSETEARILEIVCHRIGAEIIRRRNEAAQRKLQEQLFQAQKMESVGTLAGGIAHDFNNLLTGIMGFTEVTLMELGADDPRSEYLRHVLSLSTRARDLVRQLLLFSRPSPGEKERCSLPQFLRGVVELLRRTIPENIEIVLRTAPDDLFIEANASQLQQVLLNLAVNARDAMPDGGRLTIHLESVDLGDAPGPRTPSGTGRFAHLTVSDTGEGIPPEILPHIFEPFFTTKEVGKGTGLGLSVVYGIIKAHGGWVDVESTV
ncbi:MAG TPA: PAS domain S-box protein, partial [Blastocatellia bacterium]|nr:PAS domain S-box protein [Blastocatellia bacterium]